MSELSPDKRGSLMFDIGYELQQLNCGAPVDRPRIARLIERIKEGETAVSHVERITPAELEHLIEWHDNCAKFSVQSDNFKGEEHHQARAAALRKVDELLCDIGARSAPSTTPRSSEREPHLMPREDLEDEVLQLRRELAETMASWKRDAEIARKYIDRDYAASATRRSDEPVWVWGLTQEGIRDEVAQFAALMERKLKANDHKDHWSGVPMGYLLRRLREEIEELELAVKAGKDAELIGGEAADVGNFAMMIADNMSSLPQLPALPKNRADGGKQT